MLFMLPLPFTGSSLSSASAKCKISDKEGVKIVGLKNNAFVAFCRTKWHNIMILMVRIAWLHI